MPNALRFGRIRKELRGIFLTLCLVGLATALIELIVQQLGLTRGTVIYLIPVVIAATRWGLVSALVAAVCGVMAAAFFFFPPYYNFHIRDPQEVINLILFVFVAVVVSQLATRLKRQLELSRQREIDMRDLYAFSRRLAVAFDVSDIHAAIEDHLASVMQRKVVLFAGAREASASSGRRAGITVPEPVLAEVAEAASGHRDSTTGVTVIADNGDVWLVRAVSPRNLEFGVIAINFGRELPERTEELRLRVEAVLADATATLERLGVAHAISEARMRSQTDELREALIGSVSHELRTPLASILGAATVLSAAPALKNEKKLKALANDVRDEAERLNNDIQNLLDASRISSGGVKPRTEWAEPADIIDSAIERCSPPACPTHRLVLELASRSATGSRRSGADATGAGAGLGQRGEIFCARYPDHGHGARSGRAADRQRQRPRQRTDPGRTGADLGAFRPRRAPRRDHQRFRSRPVDRQRLHCRQRRHDKRRQRRPRPGQHGDDRTPGDATRGPADGKRYR